MGIEQIKVKLNPDVEPSGSDLAVCNAARRSFNTRSEWDQFTGELKDKDKRLIEFLARGMTADDFERFRSEMMIKGAHYFTGDHTNTTVEALKQSKQDVVELLWQWRNTPIHDTPFNHCFISFEVQAPIFVRAQLVKHEYLIMSEFSRRYITDDIQFYQPDVWRGKAENKKQGSSGEVSLGKSIKDNLVWGESEALTNYHCLIEAGVAPEQARMVLPQSTMTEWTWSGTLGAFAKMCQLRLHPDAQYEARLVAEQVYDYLQQYYPVSAVALVEGVK